MSNLRTLKPNDAKPTHRSLKAYELIYMHIDIKYLPQVTDAKQRLYLFVAIDRATRWFFRRIYPTGTAANAPRFLRDPVRAESMKITRILTHDGKAFTDRLIGLGECPATEKQ